MPVQGPSTPIFLQHSGEGWGVVTIRAGPRHLLRVTVLRWQLSIHCHIGVVQWAGDSLCKLPRKGAVVPLSTPP